MKLVICLTLLCYAAGKDCKGVDKLITSISTKPTPAPTINKNLLNLQPGASEGGSEDNQGEPKCVPYHVCNNGTVININSGIDDITNIKLDDTLCAYIFVCSKPRDKPKKKEPVKPPVNNSRGCGVRNPDGIGFRITFGGEAQDAQFGEFPWIVAVLREESDADNTKKQLVHQCGASLIHPQVLLTVAHWFTDKNKKFIARAGEWDTQTKLELFPSQDRDIVSIKFHPEFDSDALTNDVALLFLKNPFDIEENVDVICLPPPLKYAQPDTRCFVSGWSIDEYGKEGIIRILLKKIELSVIKREDCEDRLRKTGLGKFFQLHETLICAGSEPGTDTCKGDGGSPLMCPIPGHPGKYEQQGLVSWRTGCGKTGTPAVYSSIPNAVNWIEEELKMRNYDTSYYKP